MFSKVLGIRPSVARAADDLNEPHQHQDLSAMRTSFAATEYGAPPGRRGYGRYRRN